MKNIKKTRKTKVEKRRLAFEKRNVKKEMNLARYGAEGGSALVMAKTGEFNRRFVAAFLALVFAISTMVIGLNFVIRAEDPAPTAATKSAELESNLVLDKYITPQKDGTYNLTLSAYAKGVIKNTTTQVPTDFIFVVDQSGSMAYKDMPLEYEPTEKKDWTISEISESNIPYYYYDSNTGDYYRVYTKWGPLYELVPRNSLYLQEIIDRSSLSWFRDAGEQDQDFDSMYYYQPSYDPLIRNSLNPDNNLTNDHHFYPLTMKVENAPLYYFMTFNYYDVDGASHQMRYYYDPDEQGRDKDSSDAIWYYNTLTGDFGPGGSVVGLNYNYVNRVVVYAAGEGQSPISALASGTFSGNPEKGFYPRYTYAEVNLLSLNTGMYVQNPMFIGHMGYNQLCYRDSNGVEQYLIKTDYCNSNDVPLENPKAPSEVSWNGTLHTIKQENGSPKTETRLQALNTALKGFISSVADQAETYNADHRVAIVGFSSDASFNNNEILSGVTVNHGSPGSMGNTPDETSEYSLDGKTHNGLQYSPSITKEQYYSSLVNVRTGAENLKTEAVDSITAKGGTQPEIGFKMAKEIIEARDSSDPTAAGRKTVVIFFTDGRPGNYEYSNQYNEANEVVNAALDVKNLGATVYSVGVFNEADGNPLTIRKTYNLYNSTNFTNLRDKACDKGGMHVHVLDANKYLRDGYTVKQAQDKLLGEGYTLEQKSDNGKYIQEYRTDFVRHSDDVANYTYTNTWYWGGNKHYANVRLPYERHYFFFRDSKASTKGYPDMPDDTIADYMKTVSSSYPNAESFDGGSFDSSGNSQGGWSTLSDSAKSASLYGNVIDNARDTAANQNYYLSCSNADKLEKEFINISSMETVPAIDTSASFDLKDVISAYFDNTNATASIATQKGTEKQGTELADKYIEWNSIESYTGDVISADWNPDNPKELIVSGFDFASNYIALGKEANADEGTSADQGKKLIVTISGLTPTSASPTGEPLNSNSNGSGIIMNETVEGGAVATQIDSFESPEITRYKYTLNVGPAHSAGVFNVDYKLSTEGTTKAQSIVTRNAKEGKRYSELTDGQFKTMAPGDNNTWTDTVGNGNVVYVEYITKQPSKDVAAPPVVDPADYSLEATVGNANSPENQAKYKYYLSNNHYLQPTEQDDSTNGVSDQPRTVSLGTSADGNLFINSKAIDVNVTVHLTASPSDFVDNNYAFEVVVSWEKDGQTGSQTLTMPYNNDKIADQTVSVPYGATITVSHKDYFYDTKISDVGADQGTSDSVTITNVITNKDIYITDTARSNIGEGISEDTRPTKIILYGFAGLAVLSGGAGAAYVYRKKRWGYRAANHQK